ACSGGSSGPSAAACTDHVDLDLAPGGYRLVDATNESACLRFPAGGAEQEYLVVSYSGSGEEASAGISGGYRLRTTAESPLAAVAAPEIGLQFAHRRTASQFHNSLRRAEAGLVRAGLAQYQAGAARAAAKGLPVVGQ